MSWDWEKLKDQQQKRGDIPPQLDDFFKKLNNYKSPGGPHVIIVLLVIIALIYSLFDPDYSIFYTVGVDEEGVVTRFGKYMRTDQPGLNFKLPLKIEKVSKVRVRHVFKKEFGSIVTGGTSRYVSDTANVALMLTGDLNVAVVPWIVHYKIGDPYKYLFKVNDPEGLLGDMAEASMRLVVGDRTIDEVITKRMEIADRCKRILQKELDNAHAGIIISTIEMGKTNVPPKVQPSFNEVNQAVQEKETMILKAKEEYNKAIPAALGEKERTIRMAEGYRLDRVNRAKGDADRYLALYEEYNKARDVTKRRLYLETIKDLLPKLGDKYIVDDSQKNLLPLLNIRKNTNIVEAQ